MSQRNPRVPRAAIHQRIPAIVAGVVGLRALLKARRNRALYAWVSLLDLFNQPCVHVIGAGRRGIGPEARKKLLETFDPQTTIIADQPLPAIVRTIKLR